jgi:hypothetical protein
MMKSFGCLKCIILEAPVCSAIALNASQITVLLIKESFPQSLWYQFRALTAEKG